MSDFTIDGIEYNYGDTFVIENRKYEQCYDPDTDGRTPYRPPGMRVKVRGQYGNVLYQQLHYDMAETFYGNVIVKMDDGTLCQHNGWMCLEVRGSCLVSTFTKDNKCYLGTLGCDDKNHQLELEI